MSYELTAHSPQPTGITAEQVQATVRIAVVVNAAAAIMDMAGAEAASAVALAA
ncbi:MAG: hypothetical protein IT529_15585 [Burkholderiales bacterium]|nr:hypothetical protein [Burkholderiales bacterium]